MLEELLNENGKVIITHPFSNYSVGLGYLKKTKKDHQIVSFPELMHLIKNNHRLKERIQEQKANVYTSTTEMVGVKEDKWDSDSVATQYAVTHKVQFKPVSPETTQIFKKQLIEAVGDQDLEIFVEGVACISEGMLDFVLGKRPDIGYDFPRIPLREAREGKVPEPGTAYAVIASHYDEPRFAPTGLITPEQVGACDRIKMIAGGPEGVESYLSLKEGGDGEDLNMIYNSNKISTIVKDMYTLAETGPMAQPLYLGPGGQGIGGGLTSRGIFVLLRDEGFENRTYENEAIAG